MERKVTASLLIILATSAFAQFKHERVYSTFDNLPLTQQDTFNKGADRNGGFTHYGRFFNNSYDTTWGSWSGWALSNMQDDSTAGFMNQFSAKPGHGVSGTNHYMVANGQGAYIKLDKATEISGAYFTNSTYSYFDLLQGSGFSKKFGGDDGSDADYFKVQITSFLAGDSVTSVDFYLADYRDSDNSKDYIVNDWTYVDFDGSAYSDILIDSISFTFESSDNGMWGMNTPAYFCMDDFNALSSTDVYDYYELDEDTFDNGNGNQGGFNVNHLFFPNSYNSQWGSWSGWSMSSMYDDTTAGYGNQYSSIIRPEVLPVPNERWRGNNFHYVNSGARNEIRTPYKLQGEESLIFGLISLPTPVRFSITNSTYAYLDMLHGSGFSKKFGGEDGTDPDFFRLLVRSENNNGEVSKTDTIYLADYRFSDDSKDYILDKWVDAKIEACDKVTFELQSSDVGMWGMNTPAYFCLDLKQFEAASISDIKEDLVVSLYPNPTRGYINLKSEEPIENVKVFSLEGKEIENTGMTILRTNAEFNVRNVNSGVYFVQVTTSKGTVTKRFIKQ